MDKVSSIGARRQAGGATDRLVPRSHLLMMMATTLVATSFPVVASIAGAMDSVVLTLLRFALASLLWPRAVLWPSAPQRTVSNPVTVP